MSTEHFKGQSYEKLRKHHKELGVPWTDPAFPANETSIGLAKAKELPRKVEWKRPSELTKEPRLFVDGASSHDATQGRIGNCWFVAACSVLAGSKPLWERVIPDWKEQEWGDDPKEYSGVFRFRFWRFGRWVEVVVDDLLPTYKGELLFTHSQENNEFWGALLEKAYAKLHGNYEVLDGGNLGDALVDFTSGVSEVISIVDEYRTDEEEKKRKLFKTMSTEIEDHALMCCAISAADASEVEQKTDLGLVKGHAYGITAVRKVPIGGTGLVSFFRGREKLHLVRLQNPWGEREWTGPFGDKSPEWTNISEKEREKLGLTFNDDGEFWMPFDDFLHQFTEMSICRIINTSAFSFSKTWHESQHFGRWAPGSGKADRAGGCLNYGETVLRNPQFRFDIDHDDEDVIVQLSQQDRRAKTEDKELLVIGFHIMRVEANRRYRMHALQDKAFTSDYIKTKHIFLRERFTKGRYVILPTTFKPGESTEFLLRVFTDHGASVHELKHDGPQPAWYSSCGLGSRPQVLTRVVVKGAAGLEKQDTFGKCDPYCIIKCEGEKVKSEVADNTQSPRWDAAAVFYRKHPDKPIQVEIWNHNLVVDSFMGQTTLLAKPTTNDRHTALLSEELHGRRNKKAEKMKGSVAIEVESHRDLDAI